MTLKGRILAVFTALTISLLALDRAVFDYLYWKVPNEMEWDTSPWYNFLHYTKNLEFDRENRVLIAGSSVALYSALPDEIEKGLKKTSVRFYSHVAMSAADFYYYTDDILDKKPARVVYLFNPADFQLDHFRKKGNTAEYNMASWMAEYRGRHPVKMYYPGAFVRDYSDVLSRADILNLTSRYVLTVGRYRSFFFDPFDALMERHTRSMKSYHSYTGVIPDEGIWSSGWTPQKFTVSCNVPAGEFSSTVYIPEKGWDLNVRSQGEMLFSGTFSKKGWQDISFRTDRPLEQLEFFSGKSISSRMAGGSPYGREYFYGIRLPQNFCRQEIHDNIAYQRDLFLDDDRFLDMSMEEYKSDYFDRMYRDAKKRGELWRLNLIARNKTILAQAEFKPWLELEYLARAVRKLSAEGVRVILVNNPENSLELEKYGHSAWYRGYLAYMKSLEKDGAEFVDLKDYLSDPRYFIDYHHLTMHGARRMTPVYRKLTGENP